MRLEVRLPDATAETVLDLHEWLADQPAIRRHGELRLQPSGATDDMGATDEMGTAVDILTLIVGAGLSTMQLLLAIAQWRESRPKPPGVVVTRTGPDGVTVRIEAADIRHLTASASRLDAE
jgi:Effector Associated Constant Component 1